jgi:hypothetical protein
MPAPFIASSCITSKASPIKHRLDAVFVAKALHAGADHVGEFSDRALREERRTVFDPEKRCPGDAVELFACCRPQSGKTSLCHSQATNRTPPGRSIGNSTNGLPPMTPFPAEPNLAAIRTAPQTAIKAAQRPKRLGRRAERKEFDRYQNSQAIGFPPGHVSGARPNTGSRSNHW